MSSGAKGMPQQAACDEVLSGLHHVLPHFKRPPLLIEKFESLFSTHRTALFVSQSHQMRKCDFGDYSFSVFFLAHCLCPHWFIALQGFKGRLTLLWETCFRKLLEASALRRNESI